MYNNRRVNQPKQMRAIRNVGFDQSVISQGIHIPDEILSSNYKYEVSSYDPQKGIVDVQPIKYGDITPYGEPLDLESVKINGNVAGRHFDPNTIDIYNVGNLDKSYDHVSDCSGFFQMDKSFNRKHVPQRVPVIIPHEAIDNVTPHPLVADELHSYGNLTVQSTPFNSIYGYLDEVCDSRIDTPEALMIRQNNLGNLFEQRFLFLLYNALEASVGTSRKDLHIYLGKLVTTFRENPSYNILTDITAYITNGSPLNDIFVSQEILQVYMSEIYNILIRDQYHDANSENITAINEICSKLENNLFRMMGLILYELHNIYLPAGGIDNRLE